MEIIFSEEFLTSLLASSILMSTPILLAGLGEIFAERSGVLNLGCEGMMLMGAFAGFGGAFFTGNLWLGTLTAMIIGGLMGLLMAFMSVTLRVNQIVAGITIVLLGEGLSSFLYRSIFGGFSTPPTVTGFKPINVPVLSQIPLLGKIFFQHNILIYLSFFLVIILPIILFRTTVGLRIRGVGENPKATDTLGVNVYRVRYLCVIFGGVMASLGGAFLSLARMNIFQYYMTGGRGWIAIAVVILGSWSPLKVMGAAFLFGMVDALQFRLQALGSPIPPQFLLMLPYVLTIIALLVMARKAKAPASLGVPYKRGE